MKNWQQLWDSPGGRWRGAARVALTLTLLAAALPALAQQSRVTRDGRSWVEESNGVLTPAGRVLRVNTDLGNVRVKGGGQGVRWMVTKRAFASNEQEAKRQFERFRVTASKRNDVTVIEGDTNGGNFSRFNVDIVVEIPVDMESVVLSSQGGNLVVSNVNARIDAATEGGNVQLDNLGGSVRARTAGGNMTIGNVKADLSVKSGGGNIELGNAKRIDIATLGGNISIGNVEGGLVQTGGGSVDVRYSGGELKIATAGGTVNIGDVNGAVKVETGGGNIHVGGAKGRVFASTGGGNIELYKLTQGAQAQSGAGAITAEFIGGRGSFVDSALRTTAGDVVVYLNGGVPCTVHASSEIASGRGIRTDFPELKITTEGGDFGPKTMYLDGTLNGGGPVLKVRTAIGQIEFRRSK